MKVEKVVKPPQKPVVSIRRTAGLTPPLSLDNEEKITIRRLPPTKLPIPTKRTSFIILNEQLFLSIRLRKPD